MNDKEELDQQEIQRLAELKRETPVVVRKFEYSSLPAELLHPGLKDLDDKERREGNYLEYGRFVVS